MDQLVQVAGSLLILVAFAAAQRGSLSTRSPVYLVLNLVGSAVLAVLALAERQWGFLLLEACWAVVSAWTLVTLARERPRHPERRRQLQPRRARRGADGA